MPEPEIVQAFVFEFPPGNFMVHAYVAPQCKCPNARYAPGDRKASSTTEASLTAIEMTRPYRTRLMTESAAQTRRELKKKTAKKKKKRERKTFVVTISCTFDDVVVGCYGKKKKALARMQEAIANPVIRHNYDQIASTDTDPILVRVTRYRGRVARFIKDYDFPTPLDSC